MRPCTYDHAQYKGQNQLNKNPIKLEVETTESNSRRGSIDTIKSMIEYGLSTFKITDKTKRNIHIDPPYSED
jgi:hypothetical protein